jgi:two-component system cell cycle sensor histidine kinase PleC
VRIAILAALLLLAVYTAFGVKRLQDEASSDPGGAPLAAKAGLIAGRVEANLAAQRAGLSAAADMLKRDPGATMDAAETALRAAGGEAAAVAVVGPTGVLSVSGRDDGADWKAAVQAAAASGRTTWTGSVGDTGRLYVATAASLDHARAFVIASGDASRLVEVPDKNESGALALPDGKLITARGRGAQGATTFREAFALSPEDVGDRPVALRGQASDGAALDIAVRPVAEGALLVLAAAPTRSVANLDRQVMEGAINLLAPLAVGIALALLLMIQSRKAEVAHREFMDSEQRFRLAVEAARCGIWEWDLNADQVFLSDVPGQYEPRTAHAAERHHRLLGNHGQRHVRQSRLRQICRILPRHSHQRSLSSRSDQRHSRYVEDRSRPAGCRSAAWPAAPCRQPVRRRLPCRPIQARPGLSTWRLC